MIATKTIRLGASSIADICGCGYNSRNRLWEIKTGRRPKDPPTAWMTNGKVNEHRAIIATECDLGIIWDYTSDDMDKQFRCSREDNGLELVALLDGIDGLGTEHEQALEVKVPQTLKGEVQLKYQLQMQLAFELRPSIKRTLYAEWSPAETRKWWCYPSPDMGEQIWKYIDVFMHYITADEAPPKWSSKANPKPDFTASMMRTERV